jgi:hypothetical protein
MQSKISEKQKAVKLRQQGKTYSEILEVVPVAKSTLSLWLREVGLSSQQKQKLTAKKQAAQQRGGDSRRRQRLLETEEINLLCRSDISQLTNKEQFLIGVALYWAEGTKRNGNRPGAMVDFANSDPNMVRIFVKWLKKYCNIPENQVELRLHLHESHRYREDEIKVIWSKLVGLTNTHFTKTQYKKHNPKTVRYKTGNEYIGLVSVRVKRSTTLNRRILGWIYAIIATQS